MRARIHLAARGLAVLLLALFAAGSVWAQGSATVGVGTSIPTGPAVPATCDPTLAGDSNHYFYKTAAPSQGLYSCTATNTWTLAGGGGGTPGGSTGLVGRSR